MLYVFHKAKNIISILSKLFIFFRHLVNFLRIFFLLKSLQKSGKKSDSPFPNKIENIDVDTLENKTKNFLQNFPPLVCVYA